MYMQSRSVCVVFFILTLIGCHSFNQDNSNCTKKLKIISVQRIAVFDTTTTVVEGELINLESQSSYSNTILLLDNYETTTDKNGFFKFSHILISNPVVSLKKDQTIINIGTLEEVGGGAGFVVKLGVECKTK